MSDSVKIVIEETDLLTHICGSNDANLKTIEAVLGASVFTHGNELHLKSSEPKCQSLFVSLISRLETSAQKGQAITYDLIKALEEVIVSGQPEKAKVFEDSSIQIPQGFHKLFPRSLNQALYMEGMKSSDISFGIGPAGTGKTFLAIAMALSEVLSKKRRKLILTRPVVEAGENLGFLPGDLAQKISPYLRPLYDAMEDLVPGDIITRLEENRVIEIAPLAYMRGRSLKNCFIVLDEAQNTTRSQMKMFLTRLGEGSKAVITGDISQIDLPRPQDSGLVHAQQVLAGVPEIHFSHLEKRDVVRNPLVKKIIEAYENA